MEIFFPFDFLQCTIFLAHLDKGHSASIIHPSENFYIFFFSFETPWPNVTKLCWKHLLKRARSCTMFPCFVEKGMFAMDDSCFWLADTLKNLPLWNIRPNALIFDVEHLKKVLEKIISFHLDWTKIIVTLDDWLIQ